MNTAYHSITAFERKHLAPKDLRILPTEAAPEILNVQFEFALAVVVTVIMLDVAAFLMWAFSGQSPVDGFYAGALTAKFVSLF